MDFFPNRYGNCSLYEKITEKTGLQIEDNCYTSIMLETNITTEEEIVLMGLSEPNAVFVLTETVYLNTGNPLHITKQVLWGIILNFSCQIKEISYRWIGKNVTVVIYNNFGEKSILYGF